MILKSKIAALAITTLVGLIAAGCTTPEPSKPGGTAGAGGEGVGGMGGSGGGSGGSGGAPGTGGAGGGMADVCAAQKSLCFDVLVPADAQEAPKSLVVAAYSSLPAMGPPDGGILLNMPMPMVTPGAAYSVKISDLALSGDYFIYVLMFMPGGGMFQPVADVDYDVATPMKVSFTGAPVSLPALQLAKHTAGDGHGI